MQLGPRVLSRLGLRRALPSSPAIGPLVTSWTDFLNPANIVKNNPQMPLEAWKRLRKAKAFKIVAVQVVLMTFLVILGRIVAPFLRSISNVSSASASVSSANFSSAQKGNDTPQQVSAPSSYAAVYPTLTPENYSHVLAANATTPSDINDSSAPVHIPSVKPNSKKTSSFQEATVDHLPGEKITLRKITLMATSPRLLFINIENQSQRTIHQ